jgi:hypothetical protein
LVREYEAKFGYKSPAQINDGDCDSFAVDVARRLPGAVALWDHEADVDGETSHYRRHAFVAYQGRFYDADHPDGVDDWRQMKEFRRNRPVQMPTAEEVRDLHREAERVIAGPEKPRQKSQQKSPTGYREPPKAGLSYRIIDGDNVAVDVSTREKVRFPEGAVVVGTGLETGDSKEYTTVRHGGKYYLIAKRHVGSDPIPKPEKQPGEWSLWDWLPQINPDD